MDGAGDENLHLRAGRSAAPDKGHTDPSGKCSGGTQGLHVPHRVEGEERSAGSISGLVLSSAETASSGAGRQRPSETVSGTGAGDKCGQRMGAAGCRHPGKTGGIRKYMEEIIFCRGGGCTAKLGAGALKRVLSKLPKKPDPNLLVGFDGNDDAAVYRINEHQAIVSTLDFFPPMVEDPYLFGQVAAANALSDIYAMGGRVLSALNIVCFPEQMDMNILGRILQGGNEKVTEAGAVLAGGHSIADADIKYGLSVTGLVDPDRIWKNSGCRPGDVLILTKKLGVGLIMTAHRIKEASEQMVNEAVESMTFLNKYAAEILQNYQVHAVTDVTGFGFLVHLDEMLGDSCSAVIHAEQVPRFDQAEAYADEFYLTAAGQKNRNFIGDKAEFRQVSFAMEEVLFDPQTSGGLLVSMDPVSAASALKELQAKGIPARIVGQIIEKQEKEIIVEA